MTNVFWPLFNDKIWIYHYNIYSIWLLLMKLQFVYGRDMQNGRRFVSALACYTDQTGKEHIVVSEACWIHTLRWRHNDHAGVSNHQPHGCLLNRLFRRKSKITSKLRVTGLCVGNSPGTGEFPAQMASYAENVSIWWRHHDVIYDLKFSTTSMLNQRSLKWLSNDPWRFI